MPSDTSSFQTRRLVFIDVLRGVACLWVILCHGHASWLDGYRSQPTDGFLLSTVMRAIGIGGKGVELFIVISGFCLIFPVLERADAGRDPLPLRHFYKRRAFRILPVYYAAVAFALLLVNLPFLPPIAPYRAPGDVVPYLFLVQNNLPGQIARLNGTLWSVALEAQLYLLFPVLVYVLRHGGVRMLLGATAACSLGAAMLHDVPGISGGTFDPFSHYAMPQHVVEFGAGIAAAVAVRRPRRVLTVVALAAVAVLFIPCLLTVGSQRFPWLDRCAPLLWAGLFASVLYLASRAEARGLCNTPPARGLALLGLISFSVYVVHFPVTLLTAPFARQYASGPASGLLLFLGLGIPLILVSGAIMFLLVERFSVPPVRMRAANPAAQGNGSDEALRRAAVLVPPVSP